MEPHRSEGQSRLHWCWLHGTHWRCFLAGYSSKRDMPVGVGAGSLTPCFSHQHRQPHHRESAWRNLRPDCHLRRRRQILFQHFELRFPLPCLLNLARAYLGMIGGGFLDHGATVHRLRNPPADRASSSPGIFRCRISLQDKPHFDCGRQPNHNILG